MEKSYAKLRAIFCSVLLVVILISMFMPVVTFNSAEKFNESEVGEIKLGWYNKAMSGADLEHAGKIKVSLINIIFSSGKDVDTLTELYRLGEIKKTKEQGKLKEVQGKIDAQNNNKSAKQAELAAKQQVIADKQAEADQLMADMQAMSQMNPRPQETIAEYMDRYIKINSDMVTLNADVSKINSNISAIDKTIDEDLQPQLDAINAVIAGLAAEIDDIMTGLSGDDDARIQNKLRNKSFVKKVALRAAMCNLDKGTSYLVFASVLSILALLVLALDIALKIRKLVETKFELTDCAVKALTDIRLPIVAFILHMFTVQYFVAKTRGIVSLGSGIIVGLIAIILFALELSVVPILGAKEEGGDKYKKTVIKQSITVGVLLITVFLVLLGMRTSALMINDMQRHYPDFVNKCTKILTKYDYEDAVAKVSESLSIGVAIVAALPLIAYSALGYMLARTAGAEKVRTKNNRKPKTPLGTFYIGFIFVAVAYVLSLMLFTVKDSTKRYEMYDNCQMSVVFSEYEEDIDVEYIKSKERTHDLVTRAALLNNIEIMEVALDELKNEYKEIDDKQVKADIKSDINDLTLEIKAAEAKVDRIESNKQSNVIIMIVLATLAIAAEIAFKMTKFEAERIADSGKEN